MNGILRPHQPRYGASKPVQGKFIRPVVDGIKAKCSRKRRRSAAQQRYLLAPQSHDDCVLETTAAGAAQDDSRINGDEPAPRQEGPDQFHVPVIQSSCDGHLMKEMDNIAEVGALSVAVVYQSSKQASVETWGAAAGDEKTVENTNAPRSIRSKPTGIWSKSAGSSVGSTVRKFLNRQGISTPTPRHARDGAQELAEAYLVHYCKLPGGAIMASPLDGPAFCLQRDFPIVDLDDSSSHNTRSGSMQQTPCWTLPEEGFQALLDLGTSVVPGLPRLARDMARDQGCVISAGCDSGFNRSATDEISAQLCNKSKNLLQQDVVVVPLAFGIVFASLSRDTIATAARPYGRDAKGKGSGSSIDASFRVTVVLARLECEQSRGPTRTKASKQRQHFVLEDMEFVFNSNVEVDGRSKQGRGVMRRTNTRRRTRRLSMPVTYTALRQEAASSFPGVDQGIATKIGMRWRRRQNYRAGGNRIVPGVGEDDESQDKRGLSENDARRSTRPENVTASHGEAHEAHKPPSSASQVGQTNTSPESAEMERKVPLTVRDVKSASLRQAALWASTKGVIRLMLAAACRDQEENSCDTPETKRTAGESCTSARNAVCALLTKVLRTGTAGEGDRGEGIPEIGEKEASVVLDLWYEGFCSTMLSSYDKVGGGVRESSSFLLLQEEAPRLLLEDMLDIPAVKTGFAQRGLAGHLANLLRVATVKMKERETGNHHPGGIGDPQAECTPSLAGSTELLCHERCTSQSYTKTNGQSFGNRKHDANDDLPTTREYRCQRLPWWLFMSPRREKRQVGCGHTFKEEMTLGCTGTGAGTERIVTCPTTIGNGAIPIGETEERVPNTSRDYRPITDGASDGAEDNAPCNTGGQTPASTTTKLQEERDGAATCRSTGERNPMVITRGRITPPLLRLDALDSALAGKGGAAATVRSSLPGVSLSAASTRAASDHVPTLLSARGVTSRASARHGSGRSVRTGRTTQRDSMASTGSPTVRSISSSVVADVDSAAICQPGVSPPPSSRGSRGKSVRCFDGGDGQSRGSGYDCGSSMEVRSTEGDKVKDGERAPPLVQASRAGNDRHTFTTHEDMLHLEGDTEEAASPSGHGGESTSGRKVMPRLHLQELPVNVTAAKEISNIPRADVRSSSPIGSGITPTHVSHGLASSTKKLSTAECDGEGAEKASGGRLLASSLSPGISGGDAGRQDRDKTANTLETAGENTDHHIYRAEKSLPTYMDFGDAQDRTSSLVMPQHATSSADSCAKKSCFSLADNAATNLVLNLALSSKLGPSSFTSSSQSPLSQSTLHIFRVEVTVARLLVSLLPSTPIDHHPEDSLLPALDVLSFVGALLLIDDAACASNKNETVSREIDERISSGSSHQSDVSGTDREHSRKAIWPPELDSLDFALLARTGGAHLALKMSALQSQVRGTLKVEHTEDTTSFVHQRSVHQACRFSLECVWLTHLLLRRVLVAGTLDDEWRSALSTQSVADVLRFCEHTLAMLPHHLGRPSAFSCAPSSDGPPVSSERIPPDYRERLLENGDYEPEVLLLTAPVMANLAALLVVLIRRPFSWGEDQAWAAYTLGSDVFCGKREGAIIKTLADLLVRLAPSVNIGDPPTCCTLTRATETLERRLTGRQAVLDQLVLAIIDSFAAVLSRAASLFETSIDMSRRINKAEALGLCKSREEMITATSRVVMETSSIFEPGGPVLAILDTQVPPTSPYSNENPVGRAAMEHPATTPGNLTLEGCAVSAACLAATLRLSTAFFSLVVKTSSCSEKGPACLEGFVAPLFCGIRRRWDDLVGTANPGLHGSQEDEQERVVKCAAQHDSGVHEEESAAGILHCRLYLEALVQLVATQDRGVQRQLDKCRVAFFLVPRLLGMGDGVAGRDETPIALPKSLPVTMGTSRRSLSNMPATGEISRIKDSDSISQVRPIGKEGSEGYSNYGGIGNKLEESTEPGRIAVARDVVDDAVSFSAGDKIDGLVSVKSGRPRWFSGRVKRVNADDGTLHVCYDDGDEEARKKPSEVRTFRRRFSERRLTSGVRHRLGREDGPIVCPSAGAADAAAGTVGEQPRSRLSLEVDMNTLVDSGVSASPTCESESVTEKDSEVDDAYFVIPSVLNAEAPIEADVESSIAPDSRAQNTVVPSIDLHSQAFRTRVFSSQLGPGSSLSTPTTGRGRTLRSDQRSYSEGVQSAAVSGRSSQLQRPRSLINIPHRSSGVVRGWGSETSILLPRRNETSTSSEEESDDEVGRSISDEVGRSTSDEVRRSTSDEVRRSTSDEDIRPRRELSRCDEDTEASDGCGTERLRNTSPSLIAKAMSGEKARHPGKEEKVIPAASRESDHLRAIRSCGVALLLSMTAISSIHINPLVLGDSPQMSFEGSGTRETNAEVETIACLKAFLESPHCQDIVPSLRVDWRSRMSSTAKSAQAVLAKLICAALFDSQSYSLDGDHIAAGRFGGVIVSKCPLRLRGGQRQLGSDDQGNEEVALKIVERDDFDSTVGPNVFLEVLAMSALVDVPGVCHLYDFGVTPESYVLVVERCTGNLRDWRLARSRGDGRDDEKDGESFSSEAPRSNQEAVLYLLVFRQIASTVAAMAERGIVHLDLKCENILVRRNSNSNGQEAKRFSSARIATGDDFSVEHCTVPSVCVADFGESAIGWPQRRPQLRRWSTRETDHGTLLPRETAEPLGDDNFYYDVRYARGTERIQSPEMVLLSRGVGGGDDGPTSGFSCSGDRRANEMTGRITSASDVWSLGCLLYELLSKQPLFGHMQWSEFFVTLTAGTGAVGGTVGDRARAVGVAGAVSDPSSPLPPPLSLRPFAALGCAEVLKQLLSAMLVRNPADRPGALKVVQYVDEALAAIASSSPGKSMNDEAESTLLNTGEKKPSTARTESKQRMDTSPWRSISNVCADVCEENIKSNGEGTGMTGREKSTRSVPSSREEKWRLMEATERRPITPAPTPAAPWALLQPCAAVEAYRHLSVQRSALLRCDGCLYRLGSGAYLLALNGQSESTRTTDRCDPCGVLPCKDDIKKGIVATPGGIKSPIRPSKPDKTTSSPYLRPETRVCLSPTDCDTSYNLELEEKPGAPATGLSYSLRSVLSTVGISRVVRVMSNREVSRHKEPCSSLTGKTPGYPTEKIESQASWGSRLLTVLLPVEDDIQGGGRETGGQDEQPSVPKRMEGLRRRVLDFADGPTVLFVGCGDGCGGAAGALAMTWAMERTGKGIYETMLDFRESCAGFWVDEATLNLIVG